MERYFIAIIVVLMSQCLNGQVWNSPSNPQVYFQYDEAGNQVFRGDGMLSKSGDQQTKEQVETIIKDTAISNTGVIDEKEFWSHIRIYPVPVKDVLYIDWNNKADDLISEIGLYEQNTIHWVFQEKKISALDKKVKIDMSKKYMGVYILTFTLKNGQRLSKNITKL